MILKLIALVFLSVACAPSGELEQTQQIDQLLLQGRQASKLNLSIETRTLSLASADVVAMYRDAFSGDLRWIEFNTKMQTELSEQELFTYCKDWLESNARQYFLPEISQLKRNQEGDGEVGDFYRISFLQVIEDRKVKDAIVEFVFSRTNTSNWQLREITSAARSADFLQAGSSIDLEKLKTSFPNAYVKSEIQMWCPWNSSLVACSEFNLDTSDGEMIITIREDNNEIMEASQSWVSLGEQVRIEGYSRNYLEVSPQQFPVAFAKNQDGQISDADGYIASKTSRIILDGPRASIKRSFDGESLSLDASDGQDIVATNAFLAVQRVNRKARQHLSSSELPFLEKNIEVLVDQEGSCNAYYQPGDAYIRLLSAGQSCPNMAFVNDIIYHEWGHGLNDHTGKRLGIYDTSFSEGVGDITAAFITEDPVIGRGFYIGSDAGLRTLENNYTDHDTEGGAHKRGGIISGAFWDLRIALQEVHGRAKGAYLASELFFRHLLYADTMYESYAALLRVDDDDANPATRSPHFCLINEIFSSRGLAPRVSDCQWTRAGSSLPIDSDIFASFVENDLGQLGLIASRTTAASMYLCLGIKEDCFKEEAKTYPMLKLDLDSRSREFFVLDEAISLKPLQTITLIAKDSSDRLLGSRQVKIVEK